MSRFDHKLLYREDGLSNCSVCNGAEGSLPTLCPGRKLTTEELDSIYSNEIDFDNGPMCGAQWWKFLKEEPRG